MSLFAELSFQHFAGVQKRAGLADAVTFGSASPAPDTTGLAIAHKANAAAHAARAEAAAAHAALERSNATGGIVNSLADLYDQAKAQVSAHPALAAGGAAGLAGLGIGAMISGHKKKER